MTHFETEPCPRCGGSGTYSHCEMWGSTCFECGTKRGVPGSGRRLTKRGKVALAYYRSLLPTRLAKDLRPGDLFADVSGRARVVEVKPMAGRSSWKAGDREGFADASTGHLDIVTARGVFSGLAPDKVMTLVPTVAERDAALAAALAYEKTLTKTGTVAKRPKKAVDKASTLV